MSLATLAPGQHSEARHKGGHRVESQVRKAAGVKAIKRFEFITDA
jgi:hypothetical protein